MTKHLRSIALMVGIGLVPVLLTPVPANAQNENQRAYDAGFQNGVNTAREHRPMNLTTGDWHGDRVNDYQRGYREGYESIVGHHDQPVADYAHDPEAQRAFQAGYDRGLRDREQHRGMDEQTGDWHGDRLEAYRRGYEEAYSGGPRP
jgi:hypothetical protein